ncbi:hypothetical protein [Polyangium jinanense]|uniref:Secreted protein n=1 Tax=Polyangium jinanense TaxID=2829994 RepID=A0A9X3XGP5_9BACT|nr:hypothetical protein [Polyangium jinanense]MDC3962100.1 hypothetical protein [Polyangium jinanense]MDC3988383.1 hypothetical protein [Polyangium jinanense]
MKNETMGRTLQRGFGLAVVLGMLVAAPAPAAEPDSSTVASANAKTSQPGAAESKPRHAVMDGDIVPDCNGGSTQTPYWLTRILFHGAFCVHAPRNAPLQVDYGTTLVGYEDQQTGKLSEHQAYYSLSQIVVPPGQRRVLWAVCGGAGMSLPDGTRVVPTVRMDGGRVVKIGSLIRGLEAEETEYNSLFAVLRATKEQVIKDFMGPRLDNIRESIDTQTGPLRAALLQENNTSLRGAGFHVAPTWSEDQ